MAGRQLCQRDVHSALVITWTLTRAATASAQSCAWPPSCATPTSTAAWRAGARRALRQVYRQLLLHLNAYVAADAT